MLRKIAVIIFCAGALLSGTVQAEKLLLQQPSLSAGKIAFVYAGDIYVSDIDGKNARRLTSHPAREHSPSLSPDGNWLAFSANYDSNTDVYVMPVAGGQPSRLTFHSSPDIVSGWHPGGNSILFTSTRERQTGRSAHLFTINKDGGFPSKLMKAMAAEGTYSKDTKRLAYRPYRAAHSGGSGWHNHRGGSTPPIWILDFNRQTYQEIPHVNASDINPMWVGEDIYFLSDRDKTRNLYKYNGEIVTQVTQFDDWDIMSAAAYSTKIVYSMGGALHIFDTGSDQHTRLTIDFPSDLPNLRPQWKDAMRTMTDAVPSPTAKRIVISARGDIYTVPLEDGSTRNLTQTSDINERDGRWSPDGQSLVYISDPNGVQQLVLTDQFGKMIKTLSFGDYTADFRLIDWVGNNRILYNDSQMGLWLIDTKSGERKKIATNRNMLGFDASASANGEWIAYTKSGPNYLRDLYLYSVDADESMRITDGMSDTAMPAFSRDGAYLFFAASTNRGPTAFGLDLSTQERPRRMGVYALVLSADGKSPLLPDTGDEPNESQDSDEEDTPDMRVDTTGIQSRIVALPIPERFYTNLQSGDNGHLYFIENTQPGVSIEANGRALNEAGLYRFNMKEHKVESMQAGVRGFSITADAKTILMRFDQNKLKTAPLGDKLTVTDINTQDVKAMINPPQEWAHIFDEAWRNERDYFYDPTMHGLDWQAVYDKYKPMLAHVASRTDLNMLMTEMIGEMEVGHNRVGGGDIHSEMPVNVGLLGADIRVNRGQYVIDKIYTGELWNPFVKAPLAAPGIDVNVGDVILAVDGKSLDESSNLFEFLIGKVGKQVRLTVSDDGGSDNAREVVVEPISSETQLRHWDWVESNRKLVDEMTDGKVAYVYLPNTAGGGFTYFNRMFFAQTDRRAVILDERRNGGGQAANYITDVLSRQYLAGWKYRSGDMILSTPAGAIYGPKVMLIDQDAGSGGDFLPYSFKRMGLGTLIGKRTWGGLIGISANRNFIDGGRLTVPHFRFFTPEHEWRVENEGVSPDIDVTLDPIAVNRGEDTQLLRAITEVMDKLEKHENIRHEVAPAFPTELGK